MKGKNKMSYDKIRADLKKTQEGKWNLISSIKAKGRTANERENILLDEFDSAISALQSSLEMPHDSLTVTGPQNSKRTHSSNGPFSSLGEQLTAVMRAGVPGGQIDPKLYNAATGLNETVPSEGGFLVQQDFSEELLRGVYATGLLAPRCNRIPISAGSNGIKLPAIDESSRVDGSRWGGVQSYWADEAEEMTKSKPKFRTMELNLHKLIGLCYTSDELLQDSRALEAVIKQAFVDEIGFKLDDAIYRGTGVGQPLGLLNSGCLVTVAKEVGQAADTVLLENIIKMYARVPARNRRNAVWLINQDIEPQLYTMSLAVGTGGGPVYLPGGSVNEAPFATLFGRPVLPIEQAATLGDLGDIVLADLSSYILIDKGGIQSDMSIHVRFIFDESIFRFVYRCDGQPSWQNTLTPFKGSNALSPFVALAARA